MARSETVLIIFRLINLALLVAIFIEGFKRILYPMFKKRVFAAVDALKRIYEHITQARDDYEALEQTLTEKKSEAAILLQKVKQWRLYAQHEHARYADECSLRAEVMGTTRREQETNFVATSLRRALGPQGLEQTRLLLTKEFSDEQGKKFLVDLCHWVDHHERRV